MRVNERMDERVSQYLYISILACSRPQCSDGQTGVSGGGSAGGAGAGGGGAAPNTLNIPNPYAPSLYDHLRGSENNDDDSVTAVSLIRKRDAMDSTTVPLTTTTMTTTKTTTASLSVGQAGQDGPTSPSANPSPTTLTPTPPSTPMKKRNGVAPGGGGGGGGVDERMNCHGIDRESVDVNGRFLKTSVQVHC